MKTSSFIFAATLAIGSVANAQEERRLDLRLYENKFFSGDSLLKSWGVSMDSLSKKLEDPRSWKYNLESGSVGGTRDIEEGMLRGTVLDNRPATSGYIQEGKKYYIRNFMPDVESKPAKEGSYFYWIK